MIKVSLENNLHARGVRRKKIRKGWLLWCLHGSVVMVATVRHPGFKSHSCQFSLFSFLPKQVGFQ